MQSVIDPATEPLLRLLSVGVPLDQAADRVSESLALDEPLSTSERDKLLRQALETVRNDRLLPPARSAFLERISNGRPAPNGSSISGGQLSPADLTHIADQQLERALAREPAQAEADLGPGRERELGFSYAEALARQRRIIAEFASLDPSTNPLHLALPMNDRRRLEQFLLYKAIGGWFHTLDSLLGEWERRARRLGSRADLLHEEYVDDLDVRDTLEGALSSLSPDGRKEAGPEPGRIDENFLALTVDVSQSINPPDPWAPQGWWWFRVPREAGEPFMARLAAVAPQAAEDARNR